MLFDLEGGVVQRHLITVIPGHDLFVVLVTHESLKMSDRATQLDQALLDERDHRLVARGPPLYDVHHLLVVGQLRLVVVSDGPLQLVNVALNKNQLE